MTATSGGNEFDLLVDGNAPLGIGLSGLEEIRQNIRIIVLTTVYSCPMDRGFASTGSYIDAPLPHAVASRTAELMEAIERREPRVRVLSIRFRSTPDEAMQGRSFPLIRFAIKEGGQI